MRFPFLKLPLPVRAALLFFLVTFLGSSALAAGLKDLFAAADTLSPAMTEARLDLARARAEYQAARGMPNPKLFASRETVSDGPLDETEQTFGIQQSLGYLWSYAPKRAAALRTYESALTAYDEARRQLLVEMTDRALTALALRQQVTLVDTVMFHATHAVQSMGARFRLGDVSEYDLHRLQAELLRLHQQRLSLLAEQQQAGNDFTRLSGLPESWLSQLTVPEPASITLTSEDQAVETALQHRPLLKARAASQAAGEQAYRASKWNQLPDIAVGIGRKTVDPGFQGVALEAEIELPLFTQRRYERNLARTVRDESEIQLRAARLQIEQEVRGTYRRWLELRDRTPSIAPFNAEQARLDLSRGVLMYLHGELSPVEVVDILRSTLESFEAYQQLTNSRLLTEIELRRVTGLPLLENH
ncbi:MAG TPA: TolC family protein [bacterium]|jgi:outer membrane protein TolC